VPGYFDYIFYCAILYWIWWIALNTIQEESLLSEGEGISVLRHSKTWVSFIKPTYSHNVNVQAKFLSVLHVSQIISPTSWSITQKETTE